MQERGRGVSKSDIDLDRTHRKRHTHIYMCVYIYMNPAHTYLCVLVRNGGVTETQAHVLARHVSADARATKLSEHGEDAGRGGVSLREESRKNINKIHSTV